MDSPPALATARPNTLNVETGKCTNIEDDFGTGSQELIGAIPSTFHPHSLHMPRCLLPEALPGHTRPAWPLLARNRDSRWTPTARRSQNRSHPKPSPAQIRSSVRAAARGLMPRPRSRHVGLAGVSSPFPPAAARRDAGQRPLAAAMRHRGSCKTRQRAPDAPTDRSLKGETTLLDPRWPHGSSADVAQSDPWSGEKLGRAR
jgi:hypothetical protein